jgi:hypothetical protein
VGDHAVSRMALVLDTPDVDVAEVVARARATGDIDRAAPRTGDGRDAMDVHWGGRMQRGVVRATTGEDGAPLLLTEASIGGDGLVDGLSRQAALLQALARILGPRVVSVRDLSARVEHPATWLPSVAVGAVAVSDAVSVVVAGEAEVRWVLTHGAARAAVPDLELFGVAPAAVEAAVREVRRVHTQLLAGGLAAALSLSDGTPLRLVPVLEAWSHLPMGWPGVGRAGRDRGPGLDGPRATLSVLHRPRLGRYRLDLDGVRDRLASTG